MFSPSIIAKPVSIQGNAKLQSGMQHNLNSFSLDAELDSFYEFEGTDFSKVKSDSKGEKAAFIALPTRERKKIYNVSVCTFLYCMCFVSLSINV